MGARTILFLTGGLGQGKRAFGRKLWAKWFSGEGCEMRGEANREAEDGREGCSDCREADGSLASWAEFQQADMVWNLQDMVRRVLLSETGQDVFGEAKRALVEGLSDKAADQVLDSQTSKKQEPNSQEINSRAKWLAKEIPARILKEGCQRIIITDEIGCGVVPVDAFQREYRELAGRIACRIAAEASAVWQVTAGIGRCIKGEIFAERLGNCFAGQLNYEGDRRFDELQTEKKEERYMAEAAGNIEKEIRVKEDSAKEDGLREGHAKENHAGGSGVNETAVPEEFLQTIETETRQAAEEFLNQAKMKPGQLLVVGCSSSEIESLRIGTYSSRAVGERVYHALAEVCREHGLYLAAQCCEHLNRALILEEEAALRYGYEPVNVVPQLKAGGSFATAAYQAMNHPVAVEEVRADGGIDIGDTLIGMHLKPVAVPVRISVKRIGGANVVCARVRPKFIGGIRAGYDSELL